MGGGGLTGTRQSDQTGGGGGGGHELGDAGAHGSPSKRLRSVRRFTFRGTGTKPIEVRTYDNGGTGGPDDQQEEQEAEDEEDDRQLQAEIDQLDHAAHKKRAVWKKNEDTNRAFICRFCGGKGCKHEDWRLQKAPSAIRGLNSSWVTKDILACQRPSTRLIREYGVVDQFKQHNIMALINLQVRGEHPLCGDGIDEDGFSYKAEEFMNHGIFFYNFGWVDMGTPSLDRMMNIVQVISFTLFTKHQKVGIHCHAGYGRTGLAIACWMVYAFNVPAVGAIETVRTRRPGSVQTRKQQSFVYGFEEYIHQLRRVYVIPPVVDDRQAFSLPQYLTRQRRYLHGEELRRFKHVPKIIFFLCTQLMQRGIVHAGPTVVASSFIDLGHWESPQEEHLRRLKCRLNDDDWYGLESADVRYLAQLLLDWLDTLSEPLIPTEVTQRALEDPDNIEFSDFNATPLNAMATLNIIVKLLRSLRLASESITSRLYMRFAYALMHPVVVLPDPRPFRTLRVTTLPKSAERPGIGMVHATSFNPRFNTPRKPLRNAQSESSIPQERKQGQPTGHQQHKPTSHAPSTSQTPTMAPRHKSGSSTFQRRMSLRDGLAYPVSARPASVAPPPVGAKKPVEFSFPPVHGSPMTPTVAAHPSPEPRRRASRLSVHASPNVRSRSARQHHVPDSAPQNASPTRSAGADIGQLGGRPLSGYDADDLASDISREDSASPHKRVLHRRSRTADRLRTPHGNQPASASPRDNSSGTLPLSQSMRLSGSPPLAARFNRRIHSIPKLDIAAGMDSPTPDSGDANNAPSATPPAAQVPHTPDANVGDDDDDDDDEHADAITDDDHDNEEVLEQSRHQLSYFDDEEAEQTFESLVLLGQYVGLLVQHWEDFSAQAAAKLAQQSVGVSANVNAKRVPLGFDAIRAEQERQRNQDRYRRSSTPVGVERRAGGGWDTRIAERMSELLGMVSVPFQAILLEDLVKQFAAQRQVQSSAPLRQRAAQLQQSMRGMHKPVRRASTVALSSTAPSLSVASSAPPYAQPYAQAQHNTGAGAVPPQHSRTSQFASSLGRTARTPSLPDIHGAPAHRMMMPTSSADSPVKSRRQGTHTDDPARPSSALGLTTT